MDEEKKSREEKKKEKTKEKIKKEKEKIDELEKTTEELQKLFDDLAQLVGEDSEGMKVIKVNVPSRKNRFLNTVCKFAFSIILIVALSGFFGWCDYDNIFLFLLYVASVSFLELIIEKIIFKFFFKYLVYSLGTLNLLPSIISFVGLFFLFPFIKMKSVLLFIIVIVLYMIVKKVFIKFINDIKSNHIISNEKG